MDMDTENCYTDEEAKSICSVIIEQLGQFGRLKDMVGAHSFSYSKNGTTTFQFKGSKITNAVKIRLNGKDLYDIQFLKCGTKANPDYPKELKVRDHYIKIVGEFEDMYNDQLIETFESFTGLYLHF